jgi:hypothetical protein
VLPAKTLIAQMVQESMLISLLALPFALLIGHFALSAQPSRMCFFCNGAGPESVMEVIVNQEDKSFDKVRTDWFIKIKAP